MTCKKSKKILWISVHFLLLIYSLNSCKFRNNLYFKNISQKIRKKLDFLWYFARHGTLSHFPYKFFLKFLFFGSRKFWSKLLFLRSWNPLGFFIKKLGLSRWICTDGHPNCKVNLYFFIICILIINVMDADKIHEQNMLHIRF